MEFTLKSLESCTKYELFCFHIYSAVFMIVWLQVEISPCFTSCRVVLVVLHLAAHRAV